MNLIFLQTPFGRFAIGGNAQAVTNLFFETDPLPAGYDHQAAQLPADDEHHQTSVLAAHDQFTIPNPAGYAQIPTPVLAEAAAELDAYLSGRLKHFTVPLNPRGTPFMRRVWDELRLIPYGATVNYKDVAARAGNPKAARAAGLANNRNPIPIFIPCHRVVGADGRLTGYRGGLDLKRRLLELEGLATLRCPPNKKGDAGASPKSQ